MTGPDDAARVPRTGRQPAVVRLATGIVLILLAIVVFAGSRLDADGQEHSYDPGAVPPAAVKLTAGKLYQLSSPTGVATLQAAGRLTNLSCSWSNGAEPSDLTVVTIFTDERNLRMFATFQAPATGQIAITCAGIDDVFVDDAEDSAFDSSALLVLLTIAIGLVGVIVTVCAVYGPAQSSTPAPREPVAVT